MNSKRTILALLAILPHLLFAQPKLKNKKYQGLLWEISGNGMKKPSYLFGTMHVSSKLAFHLADSFYVGIHNADVVALETNPESWQEDMSKYDLDGDGYRKASYPAVPNQYLSINALKFFKYDKKLERALYSNPSTINNLLYRSYGSNTSDFEEDTYLDMYIYQCGKKWGKKVAGVERYGESMKLMSEAYRDAAKDKDKKNRSYDSDNNGYSSNKLQEAYRAGNLDWLDSINRYNSFSAAFDEKFLYRRNEIQATSIDSILHSGKSLFVGVGAAHLPGGRGVIEILRRLGYTLRPVKMGARDSQHKNQVEKLRVPVQFSTQFAEDGTYQVDIPGKFYKFGDDGAVDQRQYADMANGSYYMVTRIMTNAWMWGHSSQRVSKVIDSLLYENIPGKIISKTSVIKDGFPGFDIINKTRRGDIQRYNIFITPFEVLIFKMSGTGDYVSNGDEAKRFFTSIQLRPYKKVGDMNQPAAWKSFSPVYGGFSVDFPHEPYTGNDGSWIYDAVDQQANTEYRVVRTDVHNYHFAEADSFDLGLLAESFGASEFIDREMARKFGTHSGYPSLDCQYRDKSGGYYWVRFLIQGPHYYSVVAHAKKETAQIKNFLNSFRIRPFVYGPAKLVSDTSLYFTVKTPINDAVEKQKLDLRNYGKEDDDEPVRAADYRRKVVSNDSTGEKIYVGYFRLNNYYQSDDSLEMKRVNDYILFGDSTLVVRSRKQYTGKNNTQIWETVFTDTASSRILWRKVVSRNGVGFALITELDTLSAPSAFVSSFYESFTPFDSLLTSQPYAKKSKIFFSDFFSTDSVTHVRAVKSIDLVKFDDSDLDAFKKAIGSLNWKEKKYLDTKKSFIEKLAQVNNAKGSEYLKELYYAADDTLELQSTILVTLLRQQTKTAYGVFRDIVVAEPPVLQTSNSSDYNYGQMDFESGQGILGELNDSLELARNILPDLLPLINLDDYEPGIMSLLTELVDSNMVKPKDYSAYYKKFLLEARQLMKKQTLAEKQSSIARAERVKLNDATDDDDSRTIKDKGNAALVQYATLLLPFYDNDAAIPVFINQMLASGDKKIRFSALVLLMKNKKNYPDSILNDLAAMDIYRYQLYLVMKSVGAANKFPARFLDHAALAKSRLLMARSYEQPDSLVYLDRLQTAMKGENGYAYFFKYKMKKDDPNWKIATVGLVKMDPKSFNFIDMDDDDEDYSYYSAESVKYGLNGFGAIRLKEDEPVRPQLEKQLKRILTSLRKSGQQFYSEDDDTDDEETTVTLEEPEHD